MIKVYHKPAGALWNARTRVGPIIHGRMLEMARTACKIALVIDIIVIVRR